MAPLAELQSRLDGPAGLRCRPVDAGDEPFLLQLHASTQAPDLASAGLDPAMLSGLVHMQFEAQRRHYRQHYPGCEAWLIERAGPVGQLWLQLGKPGLCLMDITVLPAHRRQGVATACLAALTRWADEHGRHVHLHVAVDNPVRAWYERLGFVITGTHGLHQAMTRFSVNRETLYEQA